LSLSVALAIALTGNSLPFLQPGGGSPAPAHATVVRPACDPPWTFALMIDGQWQCAGGPGPVRLPTPPPR
jgi:hypothetical protein